ncbi:MAG: glycosyltransferase [Kaiparowitsia implicata GSE-PSE-MK54-09C]|jgi:glycosyltransferase involved in cell wall biosynthesis|nr:glycosyltransferase [Kaiparowitsia implicata GSE-PSE-MK54-09C]
MVDSPRIIYMAGFGEVMGTYQYWSKGEDDPSQVSVTYSGQFYDVCRAIDAKALVIAFNERKMRFHDEAFTIEYWRLLTPSVSALTYHLNLVWNSFRLIFSALKFRASVVVVADGTVHWFLMAVLPLIGIQVIPSLHCVLWRKFTPLTQRKKIILGLGRHLFSKQCLATLVVSDEIADQVQEFTGAQHQPILRFSPIYRRQQFQSIPSPNDVRSPFRVLYVGRVEANKGVFDLLDMAGILRERGRTDIVFDLCGKGTALTQLREAAAHAGLEASFRCHGHCNKEVMRSMFSQSHVVIVPTKPDFVEGFNKVVVEGILSARPVITSAVCPALSYVKEGVVEAIADDIESYIDSILKLCDQLDFYAEKVRNCYALQDQFYDDSASWGTILASILTEFKTQSRSAIKPAVKGSGKYASLQSSK